MREFRDACNESEFDVRTLNFHSLIESAKHIAQFFQHVVVVKIAHHRSVVLVDDDHRLRLLALMHKAYELTESCAEVVDVLCGTILCFISMEHGRQHIAHILNCGAVSHLAHVEVQHWVLFPLLLQL